MYLINTESNSFKRRVRESKTCLLLRTKKVCQYSLPKGHLDGATWRVGSIKGETGSSLSVVCAGPRKGCWKDFAAGDDHHGDILKLWMMVRGVPFLDALDEAEIWLERGAAALPIPSSPESPWLPESNAYIPAAMPTTVFIDWEFGVEWLAANASVQKALDQLRGCPRPSSA